MNEHVQEIFDWLVDGARGTNGAGGVVQRFCDGLLAAGIPIARGGAFVRTLHPQIMGRSFLWRAGGEVEIREASYEVLQSAAFADSPIARVYQTGRPLLLRLDEPGGGGFAVTRTLAGEGFTGYLALPLTFLSGEIHGITFATRVPGGFTPEHVAALEHVSRPMARVAEILALSRTAVNLLNTYVGRNAGERIIAGKIQRGDTDTIRAVIWFSDLRGFTALASSVAPGALIRVLNELFECQVPAIERRGGEVLKFMGDGLLAIFPVEGAAGGLGGLCDAAFDAAHDAFAALRVVNEARGARGEEPIRFGLALHVGDVAYGNIGGAGRLDFTCIGPAVNVASRLEGLTARLDRPVVVSGELAAHASRPLVPLGAFELKGVAAPEPVFGAPDGDPLASW